MSDPYQEAFDDVLRREQKRKMGWVLGCASVDSGIRTMLVCVTRHRQRSKAVVQPTFSERQWIVDLKNVYPTKDAAEEVLAAWSLNAALNVGNVIIDQPD